MLNREFLLIMGSHTFYFVAQKRECQMKIPLALTISQLREAPYASVLCYPTPESGELERRLTELKNHKITTIELSGKTTVYGIPAPIIGKGFVGIVVAAYYNGQRIALKIRRVDADREDMFHEAQMLKKANTVNVGPKFIAVSKNFLLMQLIDGDLLPVWIEKNHEKSVVQTVLRDLLESCWRLDELGLDHGELSKAPKHIIIDYDQKPYIVDFETASDARRTANLQALCHFLFTSKGETGQAIAQILGERNNEKVVKVLQEYKKSKTRSNFEQVLQTCLT
jgi:putative serine/threonine protein kinase